MVQHDQQPLAFWILIKSITYINTTSTCYPCQPAHQQPRYRKVLGQAASLQDVPSVNTLRVAAAVEDAAAAEVFAHCKQHPCTLPS
jgi:hypothetical protein